MRIARLCLLLLLLAGCDDAWKQFHGGGANAGFYPVRTGLAFQPKWSARVGQVVYSSPAVGGDSTVYVGNMDGELVAIAPDGTERWRRSFPDSVILSSPAVAPDGAIYVISNRVMEDKTVASQLRKVTPDGVLAWTFTYEGGVTTSSPKVWPFGQTVHILAQVEDLDTSLVIVDASGALVRQEATASCPHVVTGGSEIWDVLADLLHVLTEIPSDFDPASLERDIPEQFGWLTPTVAVVSEEGASEAGVVVAGRCGMAGLRWQPPVLEEMWSVDFGDEPRHFSSPAVFANGLLVLGREHEILAFDAKTGEEMWRHATAGPVMATPASFGRQIYAASLRELLVLDSDGTLLDRRSLGEEQTAASVALSGSLGYLSSTGGLDSFTFDLVSVLSNGAVPGPLSSPVVAEDGTVYAISGENLFAFAP